MRRFSRAGAAMLALATLGTLVFAGSSAGHRAPWYAAKGSIKKFHHGDAGAERSKKAILFASDGMRPDLMERYAAKGIMPTFKDLLKRGVAGDNGLLQGFPPNTGVGWHTLATGTWPGEHGSTNNTFHRTGDAFNNTTSFATPGILQADTLLQSAERAGKTVVAVEWVAARGLVPALQGPVVDFRTFIGGRGIALNFDLPGQPALAQSFGVQYQRQELAAAAGWTNVPASFSPAKEATLNHNNAQIPGNGLWNIYIYDSTNNGSVNYDRVLIVNSADAKDGSKAVANLGRGDWADAKLTLATGGLAGKTAGFYTKLLDLNNDASRFRIYFTSVQRVNATYNALGPAGSDAFAEKLARDFPTSTAADFAPLEALIVDEDTYVEQGLKWADSHFAYLEYIFGPLGVKADLLFLGTPITDEFQHQFAGLLVPKDIDGRANPYYDNVDGMGAKDGRLDEREGYIRAAYHEADATVALGRKLMGKKDTTVMASSDHGFAPQWLAINARKILFDAKVTNTVTGAQVSLHPSGNPAIVDAEPAEQLPERRSGRPREGLLGRRNGADLRQPDAAGRHHLRGRPDRGPERLRGPDRPGRPRPAAELDERAGHLQDHEQGGAAERRRDRRAASEPERRRRRRLPAAVPVRRCDEQPEHRVLAVLRPARLPAEPGQPQARREHARHVRRGRPGHPGPEQGHQGRPRDRRGSDARVRAGDPGAAERPRQDPLRHRHEDGRPARADDPPGQRLARADSAARRGGRLRRADVRDRRLGVPEAVVRPLPQGGRAEQPHHGRRR